MTWENIGTINERGVKYDFPEFLKGMTFVCFLESQQSKSITYVTLLDILAEFGAVEGLVIVTFSFVYALLFKNGIRKEVYKKVTEELRD